jgi:hypothetical protein
MSAKEDEETEPKRKIQFIETDYEEKPFKVMKTETLEPERPLPTLTPRKQSTVSQRLKNKFAETSKPKPAEKPEAKPVEKASAKATTTGSKKAAMPVAKETPKLKERDKKRAMIEMKLEANRLTQKEITLTQELMELDGEYDRGLVKARSKRLAAQQLVKIMRPERMVLAFEILQHAEMLANWVNGSFGGMDQRESGT